ncbi:MAG: Ger(x)C family spore germination protein [Clostridiales bacterium]|jgi:spore germination protein KC|nr:Ger(x)C family spore germination protein [Clostridiales bacterium]
MRRVSLLACILVSALLCGCKKDFFPERHEIQEIEIINVIGVDVCRDDPSMVEVTFLSSRQRESSVESGGGTRIAQVSTMKGLTVYDAKLKLRKHSDHVPEFSHVQYTIFGEDALKEGLVKFIDCFVRDAEFRFTTEVYVARGCTAKEMLQKTSTGDRFLADRLENLDYDSHLLSRITPVSLTEIVGMLDSDTSAAIVPALRLRNMEHELVYTGELPESEVATYGYAVLKDTRLVGFFDENISRGYSLLTNEFGHSLIVVEDDKGMKVTLSINDAKTDTEASFDGDTLNHITYRADLSCVILEQQSRENILKPESLKHIEQSLTETIKNEMIAVINRSKALGVDAIGLGRKMRLTHPLRWNKLKNDWSETFTDLDISVEVCSRVLNSMIIDEPQGHREGN